MARAVATCDDCGAPAHVGHVCEPNPVIAQLRDALHHAHQELEGLRERITETEKYAEEGWDWLSVALDAGGWPTVFDIPEWKERSRRLAAEEAASSPAPEGQEPEQSDDEYGDYGVRNPGWKEVKAAPEAPGQEACPE